MRQNGLKKNLTVMSLFAVGPHVGSAEPTRLFVVLQCATGGAWNPLQLFVTTAAEQRDRPTERGSQVPLQRFH